MIWTENNFFLCSPWSCPFSDASNSLHTVLLFTTNNKVLKHPVLMLLYNNNVIFRVVKSIHTQPDPDINQLWLTVEMSPIICTTSHTRTQDWELYFIWWFWLVFRNYFESYVWSTLIKETLNFHPISGIQKINSQFSSSDRPRSLFGQNHRFNTWYMNQGYFESVWKN